MKSGVTRSKKGALVAKLKAKAPPEKKILI